MSSISDVNSEIEIKGYHYTDEWEETVTKAPCTFYEKNGTIYLFYEEEGVKTRITYKDACMEVCREGDMVHRMIYEMGKTHVCSYRMSMGSIPLEIYTSSMEFNKNRNNLLEKVPTLDIKMEYRLTMQGGEPMPSKLYIHLVPKM